MRHIPGRSENNWRMSPNCVAFGSASPTMAFWSVVQFDLTLTIELQSSDD